MKSLLSNNNKNKKLGKENTNVNLSKLQKFLIKNGRKINFNQTKNIFLNKSNSVKIVKPTNPNDLIKYNNYISNKKEQHGSNSSLNNILCELSIL